MKQLLNTLFVMTEDAYLALENDNVVIYQNDQTLAKVPLRSIEGIMCFSYKGCFACSYGALRQTGRFYGILFTERSLLLFRVRGGES